MNTLLKILGPAATLATALNPALAPVVEIVNRLLPVDKQLPANASGPEVVAAYSEAPAEARHNIEAELAVLEVQTAASNLAHMVSVESVGSNTRPRIAWLMGGVFALAVVIMMLMWARAVWVGDSAALAELAGSWELMLTLLGTPGLVIRSYFGMRSADKKSRYAAVTGQPVHSGLLGTVAGLLKH